MLDKYYNLRRKLGQELAMSNLFAIIMWLAWPPFEYTTLLLFVGFIPLLFIHDRAMEEGFSKFKYWIYIYYGLFMWNLLTTWWVWFASPAGAVAMLVLNTALMSLPFLAFRYTKKVLGNKTGYWPLIVYWLAFEYLHFNWDIEWPWLTLGNGFATMPGMVQWYEYTGVFGGSLWIWIVNIAIYNLIKNFSWKRIIKPALLIMVPIMVSIAILFSSIEITPASKGRTENEIVIVQPNIDPYTEKFGSMSADEQIDIMFKLATEKIDSTTKFLILPETALMGDLDEDYFRSSQVIRRLQRFLEPYPNITVIAGADSYKFYPPSDKKPTVTARPYKDAYYDSYNTALMITKDGVQDVYHKSKLVSGVEKMPYPMIFGFLDNISADLGGTSGGLGRSKEATVFWTKDSTGIAPIICYESVFGQYVTNYVKKGAGILFIITNDGWWKDTPGYEQHLHYARLRAIETRRGIARCANTGVSCFISPVGAVSEQTEWWEPAVISGSLSPKSEMTFYTIWGDYIGRLAAFIAVAFLLSVVVRSKTKKHDFLK